VVVTRATHIGMPWQGRLLPLGTRFQRLFVEALLEDGGDALVGRGVDRQGALAGGFQTSPAVTAGLIEQSQTTAVTVLGMRSIVQLMLDHRQGRRTDVLGPIHEPSR